MRENNNPLRPTPEEVAEARAIVTARPYPVIIYHPIETCQHGVPFDGTSVCIECHDWEW